MLQSFKKKKIDSPYTRVVSKIVLEKLDPDLLTKTGCVTFEDYIRAAERQGVAMLEGSGSSAKVRMM